MSRCFPFPPPGYEKKARPDENFLAKEKHNEKKHKDKKDREKREGKEKKDKEKSEERAREKKDRKEKHKDKRDKHRDKEKKETSGKKNTVGAPESRNGEKLESNCMQSDKTNEFKFLLELGKRIRDDDRTMANSAVHKITLTGQRSAELAKKAAAGSNTCNLAEGNENFKDKREDDRQVYGQSNKVGTRGLENGSVKNFIGCDQRKVGGVAGLVDKYFEKPMKEKENNKHKNSDSRGDRHKDGDRENKSKSKEKEPNKEQLKPRENANQNVDIHNIKPSYLLKESNKSSGSEGNLGKRKEREMNGFLHDNEIQPNKLPRLVSSSHRVVENGRKLEPFKTSTQFVSERGEGTLNNLKVNKEVSSSHPFVENGRKLELCPATIPIASEWQGTGNNRKVNKKVSSSHPVAEPCPATVPFASEWQGTGNNHKVNKKVSSSHPVVENGRKLKAGPATVPFACEWQGTGNNHKVNKKVSSSHAVAENGTKLEPCPATVPFASEWQGTGINHKVNKKVSSPHPVVENVRKLEPCQTTSQLSSETHVINGLIEAQQPIVYPTKRSSAHVQVKKNIEASVKPPHPDSKYLSQILSVPNSVELSDFDDQEWLFGSNDLQAKRPRLGSSEDDGARQVWAEALPVEFVDVTALPYVIPY